MPSLPPIPFTIFALLLILSPSPAAATSASPTGYTKLVYKGCSDQKFQDPNGAYAQNLKALFSSLLTEATQKPFATATAGADQQQTAITGLYQCRGDLATAQCSDCVSKIPAMASKLCERAVAARVQLHGCYLRYEVNGFKDDSETQVLYRICGSIRAKGSGFGDRRSKGFGMVLEAVKSGGGMFYAGSVESMYVLGQCQGDLDGGDCGECVKRAVERVESECGNSISGQVYLQKCYVSYSYYPNGVPGIPSSSSDDDGTKGTA